MLKAIVSFPLSVSSNSSPASAKTSLISSFTFSFFLLLLCSFHVFTISFFSHLSIAFYYFSPSSTSFFLLLFLLFPSSFLSTFFLLPPAFTSPRRGGEPLGGGGTFRLPPCFFSLFLLAVVCRCKGLITSNGTNQLALPPPKSSSLLAAK